MAANAFSILQVSSSGTKSSVMKTILSNSAKFTGRKKRKIRDIIT